MFVVEPYRHPLQFGLEGGDLLVEGVEFAFGLGAVPDVQAVYFFGQHEHPVFGDVFG